MSDFLSREGIIAPRTVLQTKALDTSTRNQIWNVIYPTFLRGNAMSRYSYFPEYTRDCVTGLWLNHFRQPIDDLQQMSLNNVRKYFKTVVLESEWYHVYHLLEALMSWCKSDTFKKSINSVLESELCDYRIIGYKVLPVTEPVEIEAIEVAIGTPYAPLRQHFSRSLACLAVRPTPDANNSIKESISGVEYMCKLITGDPDTTMGRAINKFTDTGLVIHEDLEEGLKKLYHWTSDDAGIRHALMDSASVDVDDAKYMLVTCSAVVNYLKTTAEKTGIDVDANYATIMSS